LKQIFRIMKRFNIMLAAFLMCNGLMAQEKVAEHKQAIYGESFSPSSIIGDSEMLAEYNTLKAGDSLQVVFKAMPNGVCKAKGCWMTLRLDDENQVLVKFKDYGFFVPTDLNEEVIVNGKAFVEELSVEEQRHYAKDAGQSDATIANITAPKRTLRFEATGVLIED